MTCSNADDRPANFDSPADCDRAVAADSRPKRPQPGLCVAIHEQACPNSEFAERLIHASQSGWQDISLTRKSVWQFGAERLSHLLDEHRLHVASLGWAGGFTGSAGFTYREALEDGRAAIEEAAEIGARALVIAPGSRAGHTFRHAQRMVCDGLRALADLAARKHVQLALLTASCHAWQQRWTSVNTLEMAQQILDDVAHPAVGLAIDLEQWTGHPTAQGHLRQLVSRTAILSSSMWTQHPADSQATPIERTGLLEELLMNGFTGIWELYPAPAATIPTSPAMPNETFVHDPQIYFHAANRHRQSGGSVSRW